MSYKKQSFDFGTTLCGVDSTVGTLLDRWCWLQRRRQPIFRISVQCINATIGMYRTSFFAVRPNPNFWRPFQEFGRTSCDKDYTGVRIASRLHHTTEPMFGVRVWYSLRRRLTDGGGQGLRRHSHPRPEPVDFVRRRLRANRFGSSGSASYICFLLDRRIVSCVDDIFIHKM
jgi:hypothetical protein